MATTSSQVQEGKRRYPGEEDDLSIVAYIQSLAQFPFKQKGFIHLLRYSEATERANEERKLSVRRSKRWNGALMAEVNSALDEGEMLELGRDGQWMIRPTSLWGKATLGILRLWDEGRLSRIRQCKHCKDWFYARFRHQQFCNDPQKKCQMNHYHTDRKSVV